MQVLNRIRRAFTMTGDWDEHLYTAAFNALSASRQVVYTSFLQFFVNFATRL